MHADRYYHKTVSFTKNNIRNARVAPLHVCIEDFLESSYHLFHCRHILCYFNNYENNIELIPVAGRSKAMLCSLSLAGIVGSNPAGSMDVCLL